MSFSAPSVEEFPEHVKSTVVTIMEEILRENSSVKSEVINYQKQLTFYSKKKANINIADYMERLIRYTRCEEASLITSLIYIDRICEETPLVLTESNIFRVVLASLITAIKYNEDEIYSNNFYAKVGGIPRDELDRIEYEFLKLINYSLYIKSDTFQKYKVYIKQFRS
jgi:hypothetical protein